MSEQPLERPTPAAREKRRILLIDDDALIRELVVRALSDSTLQVVDFASGPEGIADAFTNPPDLVMLDVMLPGMNGYEVCRQLRQHMVTAHVPIIMLTAVDQIDSKVQGLRTGADDYMTKPFDVRELRMRVEAHLRRSARDLSASPLTGLPGNPLIEQIIATRIASRAPLAVLYIDLTNFKSYNDEYGWLMGDQVIKYLANTLLDVVAEFGTPTDFTGHIGGDDFVIVTLPDRAEKIAQAIIDRFDATIPEFYSVETRTRGYIIAHDRRGRSFRAPIATVAIAIVTNTYRALEHRQQVSAIAAEVKQAVKSQPGSHFAFDRRQK